MKHLWLLLALLPLTAWAGGLEVTFSAPALFTDGSTIDKTKLSFSLYGAIEGQVPSEVGTSATTTITVKTLPSGKWCGQVYAVVDGQMSEPAPIPPFCVTIADTPPPPPPVKKPNPVYAVKPRVLP